MRVFLAILICSLITGSCQNIPDVDKPEMLIQQDVMEDILYESVLLTGARGYRVSELKILGITPETYIYDKFDLDSTRYAQNIEYYTANIDLYKAMNERVLERVKRELNINDSIASNEQKEQDSLRTLKAKQIRAGDSLTKNKIDLPARKVTDSFARRPKTSIKSKNPL